MNSKMDVGILGATGTVGQEFIRLLEKHPWFRVAWLGASERSAGKVYRDATRWRLSTDCPPDIANMPVSLCKTGNAPRLVFSGLDSSVAGSVEELFARNDHIVVSNAKNYRMDADVPLLIPEINADHLRLLNTQVNIRDWPGAIVTNPNCSTIVITLALAPLRQFGIERVMVSTLQAISGAGYPGVASLDILGNILPHIPGEESKIETETQKILGAVNDGAAGDLNIAPHDMVISAQTTRVPVLNGHTALMSVELASDPTIEDIVKAFVSFQGRPQSENLPTAPSQPVCYVGDPLRPQPKLDVDAQGGMSITVGRLRKCPVLDFKFVVLGHNTVRGAAGAAVLNAELMRVDGLLD